MQIIKKSTFSVWQKISRATYVFVLGLSLLWTGPALLAAPESGKVATQGQTNAESEPAAQSGTADLYSLQIVAGITQPFMLRGGNLEVDLITKNWVFEYSHGWALDLNSNPELTQTPQENKQGLAINAPYSTGGGVGYRITSGFNLRLEAKVHQFDVVRKKSAEKISYTNMDIGAGIYYFWQPFDSIGLVVVPSIRFWPMVANTLDGGQHRFKDGAIHKPHQFGLFANLSIGYRFDL